MLVRRLTLAASLAVAVSSISLLGTPGAAQKNDLVGVQPPAVTLDPLSVGTLYLRPAHVRTDTLPDARQVGQFRDDARYVIQLDGPMTPQRRADLEARGVKLGEYLPAYAYAADVRNADPARLAELDFIVWAGEYQNQWKIDPELGNRPLSSRERVDMARRGLAAVEVTLFEWDTAREALALLRELGATVHFTEQVANQTVISATMALADVPALAELPSVRYLEEAPEITPRNNNDVRWVVQTNQTNVTPLYTRGLRGEGQIVGVLDTALDRNHCSFSDTAPIGPSHRKIVAYHPSFGAASHGTHVSGTVAGDAGSNANTRGVAYMSRITYNTWPSFTEAGITQRLNLSHSDGARMHTNSWGDDGTTAYNGLTRGIDAYQWNNEMSQTMWAVTNTSTMKNPENAKNTLAVGATSPVPSQHNHCYGGTGPTNDGRRKPEIYAPGCSTVSSVPGSCSTGSSSGTSMACPAVTGVGLLARQYYMEGFYPTGIADSGQAFEPSGALVKATLLNSAVDMTGVSGYPSNQEGWGRVLANDTLYFEGDSRRLFVIDVLNADGLSTGHVVEEQLEVLGSAQRLKVTLVWTDYPGAAGTSFASVNDLDLEVIGPSGTYRGNVFSGGVSVPGGSKDDRNNVEQVHINNPTTGTWTIRVIGAGINQSTQGYALVVTGDIAVEEPPLSVSLPNGAPGLIDPGVPTQFQVRIAPGQENIVGGSEKLFYRLGGGSFISADLQPIGGDLYTATIPATTCDSPPQFYVQAQGDGGTYRTSPSNAPASYYESAVGEIAVNQVFYENFAGGLPAGWSATGLWNVTGSCVVSGACDGGQWAYYGQTGSCDYNAGNNNGAMTSASIAIPSVPPGGDVTLSFCYNLLTESSSAYDKATFSIVGGPAVELDDSSAWTEFTMDLTEFAGQTIQLRWHFDTIDGSFNNYRGWQVDAIEIVAAGLECEDVVSNCPEDLTGSGSVGVADLLMLLSAWGPCPGCDEDVNQDGDVSVADMLQILQAWGDCP